MQKMSLHGSYGLLAVMEIDSAIFQDLKTFGKGDFSNAVSQSLSLLHSFENIEDVQGFLVGEWHCKIIEGTSDMEDANLQL